MISLDFISRKAVSDTVVERHSAMVTDVLWFVGLGIEILLTTFRMDGADLLQINTETETNLTCITRATRSLK